LYEEDRSKYFDELEEQRISYEEKIKKIEEERDLWKSEALKWQERAHKLEEEIEALRKELSSGVVPVSPKGLELFTREMSTPKQSLYECILYAFEPQLLENYLYVKRGIKSLRKLVSHFILKEPSLFKKEDLDGKIPEEYIKIVEDDNHPGGKAELLAFSHFYKCGIWKIESDRDNFVTEYIARGKYERMIFLIQSKQKGENKFSLMVGTHSRDKNPREDIRCFSTADNYVRNKVFNIIQESRLELENFFTMSGE